MLYCEFEGVRGKKALSDFAIFSRKTAFCYFGVFIAFYYLKWYGLSYNQENKHLVDSKTVFKAETAILRGKGQNHCNK